MIEIVEPPDVHACAPCSSPVLWLYSPRTKRWVSFVADPGDRDVIRRHRCRDRFDQPRTWRTLVAQPPEIAKAGVRRARAVLAAKPKERT